jgi:hypothetical protein
MAEEQGCLAVLLALVLFACLFWLALPVASVVFVALYVGIYLHTLYGRLPGAPAPERPLAQPSEAGEQPAYRQYFFGQAVADLGAVTRVTHARCSSRNQAIASRLTRSFFTAGTTGRAFAAAAMVLLFCAMAVGAAVTALALAFYAVVVGLGVVLARAGAAGLRVLDTALLRIRGIDITCGSCHHRVPYPAYGCPGPGCSLRHTDVRPGRFGVLARTCFCGRRMPTLLLLGSHRMQAYCPYCDHPLVESTGTAPEVIAPLLGATGAGKTRLMLALAFALEELGTVDFASPDTRQRLEELRPALRHGLPTRATSRELPRAYSLYATLEPGQRRLVHLFDVAGERFNRPEDVHELRYLARASSFLFVLDPLSLDAFWEQLSQKEQEQLASVRSVRAPQAIFDHTSERIEALGVDRRGARLLVVLSKNDLLRELRPLAGVGSESREIEAWLAGPMCLGNLVRSMKHDFGDVHFTCTAAVVDRSGVVDPSITSLTRWLLQPSLSRGW